jgi:hypothetical protein
VFVGHAPAVYTVVDHFCPAGSDPL